jgi:hypothetical protein
LKVSGHWDDIRKPHKSLSERVTKPTDEECYLLGYSAVQSVESQLTFRRNISAPSSGSNKPSKIPARKQVAKRPSVGFQRTTQCYMAEDITLITIGVRPSYSTARQASIKLHRVIPKDGFIQAKKLLSEHSLEVVCIVLRRSQ